MTYTTSGDASKWRIIIASRERKCYLISAIGCLSNESYVHPLLPSKAKYLNTTKFKKQDDMLF